MHIFQIKVRLKLLFNEIWIYNGKLFKNYNISEKGRWVKIPIYKRNVNCNIDDIDDQFLYFFKYFNEERQLFILKQMFRKTKHVKIPNTFWLYQLLKRVKKLYILKTRDGKCYIFLLILYFLPYRFRPKGNTSFVLFLSANKRSQGITTKQEYVRLGVCRLHNTQDIFIGARLQKRYIISFLMFTYISIYFISKMSKKTHWWDKHICILLRRLINAIDISLCNSSNK